MPAREFNVDREAEAVSLVVVAGERRFKSVPRTGDVYKKVIQAAPLELLNKGADEISTEEAVQGVDIVYAQLALLLADEETGEPPAQQELERLIEVPVARKLMRELLPPTDDETPA